MRRPFTLIEICVCLVLLAAAAGAISWQVWDMFESRRFDENVRKLKNQITELQMAALIYGSDQALDLEEKDGKWRVTPRSQEARFYVKPFDLVSVDSIQWEGLSRRQLTFQIFTNGRIEPTGVLQMASGERKIYLDLLHPLLIKIAKEQPQRKLLTVLPKPENKGPSG